MAGPLESSLMAAPIRSMGISRINPAKKEAKISQSRLKAKKYAEEILDDGRHKGAHMLLGSTKLAHLSGYIADAAWYAFQIVNAKKDIVFEGIANALDVLASDISTASENG